MTFPTTSIPVLATTFQSLIDMHAQGKLAYSNQSVQVTEPDIVSL